MEVPTVCFAISSSTVCLNFLLSALMLPRRNRSFRPLFLMPLLHFGCPQRLFPSVSSLGASPAWSLTTLSLARCRNGTAGLRSAGGSQLLPEPTIALGPILQLSGGALRLIQCPFFRVLLKHRYGLYFH
jgi:hypothetical protein